MVGDSTSCCLVFVESACGQMLLLHRDLPICSRATHRAGSACSAFDGRSRARLLAGRELKPLMYLGALAEYCIVPAQAGYRIVPKELPFEQSLLIGFGVMTGSAPR